jgi:two-component system sensor histidine kinase/response regulator
MTGDAKVTILIIDDKTANIFALEKLLEKPERIFITTTDGQDGLRIAKAADVDLIILDVQMPEMDGFEVAQILKSNKKTRDIPIIFASAEKKEKHSILKGFEEGAVDYLSKPLDPDLTKAKVSVLLKIQLQKKELLEKNLALEKADTQIKVLNSTLQKNMLQLKTLNKEMEAFSYSVSHDLRTPLRSIIGYARVLEEDCVDKLDVNDKRILGTIKHHAGKMNCLINDLLAFSKLGNSELKKSEIDIASLVRSVITDMKASIQPTTDIKLNHLFPALGDPTVLTQVWINLISNALKYSSKKENPLVEIGSRKTGDEIVYYVKDNGAGFSMDYADKLFGVFQRLHKHEEFEGTGLGLALVKRIIDKHDGRVWAEGKVNEGATFYFALPNLAELKYTISQIDVLSDNATKHIF